MVPFTGLGSHIRVSMQPKELTGEHAAPLSSTVWAVAAFSSALWLSLTLLYVKFVIAICD